jgi:hypothetical protein
MVAWWPETGHITVENTSSPAATRDAARLQRRRSNKPAKVVNSETSRMVPSALTNHGSTALGLVAGGSTAIPMARPTTQATITVSARCALMGSRRRVPSGVGATGVTGESVAAAGGAGASGAVTQASGSGPDLMNSFRRSLVVAMAETSSPPPTSARCVQA